MTRYLWAIPTPYQNLYIIYIPTYHDENEVPEQAEVHHLIEGMGLLRADRTAADAGTDAGHRRVRRAAAHRRLGVLFRDPEQGAAVALGILPETGRKVFEYVLYRVPYRHFLNFSQHCFFCPC